MKKIVKHELVEIILPANTTATKFQIPDQPNLRETLLMGVEIYTAVEMPKSVISGNDVISLATLKTLAITFQDYNGVEFLKQAPGLIFKTIEAATTGDVERDIKNFAGQKVNYPKSYIQFASALSNVVPTSVILSVYYYDPTQKGTATFKTRK